MRTPTPTVHIAEVFPSLQGLQKETVRLHPRRGPDPGLAASKMGGLFLWPANEPWPRCTVLENHEVWVEDPPGSGTSYLDVTEIGPDDPRHNDHLVGVLQLRQEDVPEMAFYPGADLFQLLWCPRHHPEDYTPFCRVYWRRAADVTEPRTEAPRPRRTDDDEDFDLEGLVPRSCTLSPERVMEYPWSHDLPASIQAQINHWKTTPDAAGYSYYFDLSVASGTKVEGYYTSLSLPEEQPVCPTCHGRMEYLLTIASAEWGSGEGHERWCPEEERGLLQHDPAIDPRRREMAITPAVFLSRGYDLNVFICRLHSEWPIAWSY